MRSITSKLVLGCSNRWQNRYVMPLKILQRKSCEAIFLTHDWGNTTVLFFLWGGGRGMPLFCFKLFFCTRQWHDHLPILFFSISSLTTISWMLFLILWHISYALSGLRTMPKCQIWKGGIFCHCWYRERDAGWASKLFRIFNFKPFNAFIVLE